MASTSSRIYLQPLTPLHIGGAQEKHLLEGVDFIWVKGGIIKLDLNLLIEHLGADIVTEELLKGKPDWKRYLKNGTTLNQLGTFVPTTGKSASEIKCFIQNGLGESFIPGSSLKGAIRTWIAQALLEKVPAKYDEYFGRIEDSLFKYLLVGDAVCVTGKKKPRIWKTRISSLLNQGGNKLLSWKQARNGSVLNYNQDPEGFSTYIEGFDQASVFATDIHIKADTLAQYKMHDAFKGRGLKGLPIFENEKANLTFWFKTINASTINYLEKEIKYVKKYQGQNPAANKSSEITEALTNLLNRAKKIEDGSQAIMRMGFGSGFHSMTGDLVFADHINTGLNHKTNQPNYKTRRWAIEPGENPVPMGFVLLSTTGLEAKETSHETSAIEEAVVVEEKPPVVAEFQARQITRNSTPDAVVTKSEPQNIRCDLYLTEGVILKDIKVVGARAIDVGTVIKVYFAQFNNVAAIREVNFDRIK